MKKSFYNNISNILKQNKESYVITIISGTYKGKNLIGQKLLKSKENIFIEDEKNRKLWDYILENIDFNKGTYMLKLKDGIEVFVEYVISKPHLVICGGGHIAVPLCKIAKILEFNVTIIDNREEFANKDRFLWADNIICKEFEDAFKEMEFNKNTYFVIVTRGHKDDRKCLEIILNNDFFYVGMIGSKGKVTFVINSMLEDGYKQDDIDKVHAPIGLKIGAKTPAEIAVSIAGELIEVKNKKIVNDIDYTILNEIPVYNKEMVLTTIIDKRGSSPRGIGTKMLVYDNGNFTGTVGGGSGENAVYEKALELIKMKKNAVEEYDLSNSKASKLGMVCGGRIRVLFEYFGD